MTQYANFDHTLATAPVIGWYDTGILNYPNLPDQADLLEMTADQWTARMTGFWAVQDHVLIPYSPPPPTLSLIDQANFALASGLTIHSTSSPGLNGPYSCDVLIQGKIGAVSTYILVNSKFPGGADVFPWLDFNGEPHVFMSTAMFQVFATAIADYVSALDLIIATNSGSLPVSTVTIA